MPIYKPDSTEMSKKHYCKDNCTLKVFDTCHKSESDIKVYNYVDLSWIYPALVIASLPPGNVNAATIIQVADMFF